MLEFVMLGTAASAPSVQRGLPSQMVLYQDARFLVDCGEGTQRQILRSGLGFRHLNRVLLTHGHLDHILGLGGLISTFARWEAVPNLEIYGGRRTLSRVEDLLFRVVLRGARLPMSVNLYDVHAGLLFENDTFEVQAFNVAHRGPDCFGYLFREKSRRPFLPEKAARLGIPQGPMRRELVNGHSIKLADGREIQPEEVLGAERPGVSVAFTGDIARVDNLVEVLRGVDVLVCEATYLERDVTLARRFGHLTAARGAWLAREVGAHLLVFNHLSQRYRVRELLEEGHTFFPDVVVAQDFDRFTITREKITLTHYELHQD